MYSDAHCHPFDLLDRMDEAGLAQGLKEVACAASSSDREQFEFNAALAEKAASRGDPPLVLCFAVHPQYPAAVPGDEPSIRGELLPLLETLASGKRLNAIGEAGFDLYNDDFKNTEEIQDEIFNHHLEIALNYDLPMVIHCRRAMHKIFFHEKKLRRVPALVFHSWSGTMGEGEALLRRGINAYFSFGAAVYNNHRQAQKCCALLPAERILLETDAPFVPPRGKEFSSWADLGLICETAANLRKEAGSPGAYPEEMEALSTENFFRAFSKQ